jgi:hypothetical protein
LVLKERFMRTLSIVLILGTLAACASSGGYMEYKPEHWKGNNWAITGKASVGTTTDTIYIKINDSDVIIGDLSKQKPEDEFSGSYEGYDISAKCKLVNTEKSTGSHDCVVSVNNKMAGQLSF